MKCSTTPSYYYYYYWLFATTIIHTIFLAKYHAVTAAAVVVDDYEASSSIRSGLRGGVEYASINKDDQSSNLNTNTNKDFRNKGSKSKLAKFDCTIQISTLLEIPSYSPPLAEDTIFSCTMNPSDVNGISGLTRNLDMNNDQKQTLKRMWKEGKLIPNESKLKLGGEDDGVEFDTRAIRLPMGLDLEGKVDNNRLKRYHGNKNNNNDMSDSTVNPPNIFHRHNRARHLTTTTGTKSILVVKVIDSENRQRPETPAQIGDDVFGTLGDPVNLASQLHACSMGKLTVRAGVHNENANAANRTSVLYAAPGVIEVHLPIPLTIADREVIHNSVTSATQEYLGFDLPGPYDHVMYVLEDCYGEDDCGWGAYAYVNHWVSVYRGKYYRDVGVQMHELGHNFGLEHSGGLDGKTYTDHTGMMGNPLYSDDTGKMCFNAAKNWQLGWYDDRKVTLQPIDATTNTIPPNWSTSYTMVGIADYLNIPNLPVILKLETNTDDDYFIGFNRATGVNLHNDEGDDLVTIVETGANGEGFSQSYLKGIIGDDGNGDAEVSDEYTIYNFADTGTNVTVRLSEIDRSTSVWKANVWVGAGTASYCDQKVSFTVNVTTDNYPTETSWTLTNKCSGSTTGTGVEVSKELGSYTDAQTSYSGTYWVCPGEYTFEIFDSYNDGICCAHSEGSYTIVYDGNVIPVATGGDFGISESTTFGICDSGDDDGPPAATSDPTKSPTILPTSSPTAQPTAQPSSQPTNGPSTQPTTQPTAQPSAQPTTPPSTRPTTQPTTQPTAHPSAQPSTQPTAQPTNAPSKSPTPPPRGSVIATFDSILNAPKCSEIGTECTSELLLNGKSNNREPNGDNTLDSCADGTDGTYHGDESIDKIRVYTVPGGGGDVGGDLLREGDMAEIEAVVWAWRNGSEDTVDFYYAADVLANNNDNNPNWVFIGSEQPDGGGLRKVAVRYQLPAGSITTTQAVRVNLRWRGKQGGASGSCSGGRYDDVDDLVFSVAAAAATDASAESALNTFGAMSAIMSKAPDAPPLLKAKPQNWGCKSLGTSKERCEAASSTCRWKNGRRRKGCYDRK